MTANCPACGAPVTFRFSNAVQTVCGYCHSILVRRDVDVERVGQASDVPDDASPIQLGSDGLYAGKSFSVAGRIIYGYELGTWNEWHIVFNDGSSGWLSDAQLEYAVTVAVPSPGPLPERGAVKPGQVFQWQQTNYQVSTITLARYNGVEGELPFEYWDKSAVWFIDLMTADSRFATVDYSEQPPLLFLGEAVEFDSLQLKNLRDFEGWNR